MAHSAETLGANLAFCVLIDPADSSRDYITEGFGTLEASSRDGYLAFARQIAEKGRAGIGGMTGSRIDGGPLGVCLFDESESPVGAMIFVHKAGPEGVPIDRILAMFSQFGSLIIQHQERAAALRAVEEREREHSARLSDIEQKFSALINNVPGAIFRYIRDPLGGEEIEFMSSGCEEIWEYRAAELQGDPGPLWACVLPEDLEAMQSSIRFSEETGSLWQHRWRIRSKSGFLKWLQAYGTPFCTADGKAAWYTLILDVTVEQDAQIALADNTRLLHEAQRMESIGRLAGGVAHDFNNLLAVIVGNAEALGKTQLPADETEALQEILEASHRGAALVKQLLSFARRSDLRTTVTDMREVLSSVDGLLRRVLPANISLEVVQRAGMWPVQIDRDMFESALLNIVGNARDAMPHGGAITIETSNKRVDSDYILARDEDAQPGRYVMVAVTDTGAGIDEAALPFVFDPFFSTKGPRDGTGLGLAMVQGFVKQSKGIIRIYSEQRRGTSIKMYFPAAAELSYAATFQDETLPKQPSPATILLVEDQEGVRRVVEKTIVSAGYQVISAGSGDEAIDIYQQRHGEIDVIVTDVVMPGKIQGPQLVRLARKINHNVPALYMSGYPHEANVHSNGIRAGDISLLKPVRRTDLLTALTKLQRQL
ncbi:MAG: response regulator [Sphingopyxis sp.]|nr:response regulator [Sphingopyxis sp.]